jgi:hypothetical protein
MVTNLPTFQEERRIYSSLTENRSIESLLLHLLICEPLIDGSFMPKNTGQFKISVKSKRFSGTAYNTDSASKLVNR